MLNNNKIKIMSKLAIYEKGKGKEDIRASYYYKADYIRLNLLKTIVSTTCGFLLIVILALLYNAETFINEAMNINYQKMGGQILLVYIGLVAIYILCSFFIATNKYQKSRKNLSKYNKSLNELKEIYSREETEVF